METVEPTYEWRIGDQLWDCHSGHVLSINCKQHQKRTYRTLSSSSPKNAEFKAASLLKLGYKLHSAPRKIVDFEKASIMNGCPKHYRTWSHTPELLELAGLYDA